ncbi:hypothetical protein DVP10_21665 [Yersinia enterocolitica]|nr:hypothetical protein [Yersinia enterocolitica]EKN5134553.1 hypothetical protein [Yersinia enterocolitica]EKN5147183.1 hypothetical protein [Yersinia enterocolitica]HDM8411254.1 hypothetical protein [Yersinia enterocolitica]HEI6937857.1 hypothetical protein [Yersinia enterocolitica]
MILKFGKRYKIDDLNSIGISGSDNRDERSKIKIAIIDDEDIPFLNSLRNSGYNIQHYRDVDNFNMLSDYQIVISDIDGVGHSFSSEYQGAYIIKELKRLFPDKYLIAMSSKIYNLSFTEILSNADVKINRDVNVDIVSEKLNIAIKEISSVKNRWLRVRAQLINEHFIDLYDVWSMEQDVIKSILTKENKIDSDKIVKLFGSVVSGVVVNFISGVIS